LAEDTLNQHERWWQNSYLWVVSTLIAAWLGAWIAAFPNLYGWLTDDAMTFSRIMQYEQGGKQVLDIQWFHAYMWFIATIPWLFHWSIPSHTIPRTWQETGHFRALILLTICLHAVLLGIIAGFFRQLCQNRLVCLGAFLLFISSPTFNFYADLLDSRYLGLIAGLPAIMLMLRESSNLGTRASRRTLMLGFLLPGFLVGVGQAIHYTELYLNGAFSAIYWLLAFYGDWVSSEKWKRLVAYVLGIVAWFVPVQLLSLHFHDFSHSMIGTLIFQVDNHISPYGRIVDIETWAGIFFDEMGLPMMLLTCWGAAILALDRFRPPYITRFNARIMVWTTTLASIYFLWTPTYPFYRQVSGLQLFYAIFALVAIERITFLVQRRSRIISLGLALGLFIAAAYVPSILRSPEVFRDQQGLGKAVNLANRLTSESHIHFMATYDWDPNPKAITSRRDFDRLSVRDYIVTDYPIFYHVKYPDIFALMHDTGPIASFPTLWCTQETWAELRSYFWFRKWFTEPDNCDAQVYSVAAIRKNERGAVLPIASVTADSQLSRRQGPARVFAIRNPRLPLDDNYFGGEDFADLWASRPGAGPHWLQVRFERPTTIARITVVPPDWMSPPSYLYTTSGRVERMRIFGGLSRRAPMRLLWSGRNLKDHVIFTARFTPARVRTLRFVVEQADKPKNQVAAIEYIRFPGYIVTLKERSKRISERSSPAR
jgi:hypothetical protein